MNLAEKLVSLRKQKGLTQMDLAEKLNVSRQAISRWEVGAAVPSVDNLKVLGEIYGIQIDCLLNDGQEHQSTEIPKYNSVEKEKTYKNCRFRILIAFALVIVVAIIVLICFVKLPNKEQDQRTPVPIEDMNTEPETDTDYLEGTFAFD